VDKEDPDRFKKVAEEAYYECEYCRERLSDYDKPDMLRNGEWRAESGRPRQRKIGFRLSSLYSPWVKFGSMAAEFLRSKPFPEKHQNLLNSWLGGPWVEKSTKVELNRILELRDDHPRGVVPLEATALTAGVDCQLNGCFYVIRAWARPLTSWLVREGFVEEFQDLDQVLFGSEYFRGDACERLFVNLTCIDSGFKTDEVYKWARRHSGYVKAIKGATHALKAPFVPSRIDYNQKGKLISGGLILWLLDTAYWKDVMLRRLQMHREDPGAWIEHAEITR
jgi:phage terminase large subunit GpA-like protein